MSNEPTYELYHPLQEAFNFFNKELFDGLLPHTVITIQREYNTLGYFQPERWLNPLDKSKSHEIALNSEYFGCTRLIEILGTLAHEMVHLWQYEYGKHRSRRTYHNKEWAAKMKSIGLQPTDDGTPTGKETGQKMTHLPLQNSIFMEKCILLTQGGFKLNLIDLVMNDLKVQTQSSTVGFDVTTNINENELDETKQKFSNDNCDQNAINALDSYLTDIFPELAKDAHLKSINKNTKKTRTKYACSCKNNVWGKPNLKLQCLNCDEAFQEVISLN